MATCVSAPIWPEVVRCGMCSSRTTGNWLGTETRVPWLEFSGLSVCFVGDVGD